MSKLAKGLKILSEQGPGIVYKKLLEKRTTCIKELRIKKAAKKIHVVSKSEREYQQKKVFAHAVKFSIITPLYNTPKKYLTDLIESLERQTYPNWELCLADGSDSKHGYVERICKEWENKDGRIRYLHLRENKGISENTNECIKLATGEYFGLLDHDDVLHETALFEMMSAIERHHADFLFSDEVKFYGKRETAIDFNFKPGFGKDELRSHNYICHFTVFSRELLNKAGQCYRQEFDGSQDHDMVLRLTEKARKIVHVPKVLYYWRVHPESVSMNLNAKEYAIDAAVRAVQDQLERAGELGKVECNFPYRTIYRVRYRIEKKDSVDIIVHGIKKVKEYKEFVRKVQRVTAYKNIKYIPIKREKGSNFGEEINVILNKSNARYIIIMDVHCEPLGTEWIEEMIMYARRKDVAAVAPKILYPDNTVAYAGISLDNKKRDRLNFLCKGVSDEKQGYEAMLRYVRNTTAVWRGCFMIERNKLKYLGGLDCNMRGYEEIDLSLRALEHGYWNVWTCFSKVKWNGKRMMYKVGNDVGKFDKVWRKEFEKEDRFYHPYWKKLKLV